MCTNIVVALVWAVLCPLALWHGYRVERAKRAKGRKS
jgi:hypothetical protein